MKDKVVITGSGLVTSLGLSAAETWKALMAGQCGINLIDSFDTQGFPCHVAARVHGLGPAELGVHPRDSRIMDKHAFMLLKGSRDAFKQAQLDSGGVLPEDIGYFAGMGMVDYNTDDLLPAVLRSLDAQGHLDYDMFYSGAYQEIHPLWPLSMLNNVSFCQVAIDLGIKGENTTFSPHADSGVHAIIEAYNTVIEEKAKVVLAGGVSEKVSPPSLARALWSGILDTSDNKDAYKFQPFGKDRRGTVLGEGCGIITVELASVAKKRKVPPLAAVTGYGTSCEISKESPCPSAGAISLSMEQALDRANIKPPDIDLIIAHGDGTFRGDMHEIEAIHRTFSGCIDTVPVFSSKGAIGHLLAGAAAVDAVLGIYILKSGIIPAAYNPLPPDDHIKFAFVHKEPMMAGPERILINSSSYEGQCASLVIEKAD